MKDDTLLARWLAGELDNDELEKVRRLPNYASLVKIREQFEQVQRPGFESESMLQEILAQEKNTPKATRSHRTYWLSGIAAAIVILLGFGISFFMPEKYTAPNTETVSFTLPDESKVILNAGSHSSYHDRNWEDNRIIELEGEAYFDVAKGKTFTVRTSLGEVTVLGTRFNVKARENRLDVTCFEGRVRVDYNGKTSILTPQRELSVLNGRPIRLVSGVTGGEPGWMHGTLVFSKEKLSAVLEELERKYDITIKTDFKSSETFSGTLPGDDLDTALEIVSSLYKLKAGKQGNTITLKPMDAKR